jgi:hypothetical protein
MEVGGLRRASRALVDEAVRREAGRVDGAFAGLDPQRQPAIRASSTRR